VRRAQRSQREDCIIEKNFGTTQKNEIIERIEREREQQKERTRNTLTNPVRSQKTEKSVSCFPLRPIFHYDQGSYPHEILSEGKGGDV
jgi:hypothetical protein